MGDPKQRSLAATELDPMSARGPNWMAPYSAPPSAIPNGARSGVHIRAVGAPTQDELSVNIEAYAKLVVDLFCTPYGAEYVLDAYRLEESQVEKLHALWRSRLDRDADLNARFRATRARIAQEMGGVGPVPSIRFR